MMSNIVKHRSAALSLYRQLMRYSQNLQLTDQGYFSRRIRLEFQKNRNIKDADLIEKEIARGGEILKKNRFL